MNAIIIDQFNKLIQQIKAEYLNAQMENNTKDAEMHSYRLKQMKRVLSTILMLDFEIKSAADLKDIPGIGAGTLKRISEILETGRLAELDNKYDQPRQAKINAIHDLLKIIGVGDRLARKLVVELGITNIDAFRAAVERGDIRVGRQVKLGLKYYDVLQKKIPRSEIGQIEKYLSIKAHEINADLQIVICGSYRRGRATSGDIDVILYHPNVKYIRQIFGPEKYGFPAYLELFVELLHKENFLLDDLTTGRIKYMGFCQYKNNPVRRIDIRFMPYNSLPAAILYFTGPVQLNEDMRQRAKKRGMLLNEYGLYLVDSHGNRVALPIESERDIFEDIGMKYLTPAEREKYA